MRKLRQLVTGLLVVLMVCSMSTTAFAVETVDTGQTEVVEISDVQGRYVDVLPESKYFESIEAISDLGYVNGIGNNQFAPDLAMTIRQMSVMLARHFDRQDLLEKEVENGLKFGEYCGSWLYKEGIIHLEAVVNLDQQMCRCTFYDFMFRIFNIDVYPASLYPDGEQWSDWESSMRVALEIGLCDESAQPLDIITRGEAVYTLHWLMNNDVNVLIPDIVVEYPIVNTDDVILNRYLVELNEVPENIMKEFIIRGWKYDINYEVIDDFGRSRNDTYIGLCNYNARRIYVCDPTATLHEFGHFLDYVDGWASSRLWHEHAAASEFLREYAMTDAKEYYAYYFVYFLGHQDNPSDVEMMQELTPNTYAYFAELAAADWDT